jgi:hypothetical protein
MDQITREADAPPPDTALPEWLPPDDVAQRSTRCGDAFDAVRVPEHVGAVALERLAGRSGPVIAGRHDGVLYWLIKPGSGDDWELPSVKVYGESCYLSIPSAAVHSPRAVHWLTPPQGDCLTDPDELRTALTEALADSHIRAKVPIMPEQPAPPPSPPPPVRRLVRCGYCHGWLNEGDETKHNEKCPRRPRPRG